MPISRSFNKLNGLEIAKIMQNDIQQALSRDDAFRQHVTYLEFLYEVTIDCKFVSSISDPLQETTQKIAGGKTLVSQPDAQGQVHSLVPEDAPRGILEVTRARRHSGVSEPPDKLRQESGLHVPRPQLDKESGQVVDTPLAVVREQREESQRTATRAAALERDQQMSEQHRMPPPNPPARPVQELARDVVDTPSAEPRMDLVRAERVATVVPPEHVVVEETGA